MNYGGLFDVDHKINTINSLKQTMDNPNFWENRDNANKIVKEYHDLKNMVDEIVKLKQDIDNNLTTSQLLVDKDDEEIRELLVTEIDSLDEKLDQLELKMLLGGPYDKNNAILEIHAGAGGTEACDWGAMLYRMYTRWCEQKDYEIEVLDYQYGDEAGIKSASILVKGTYAYGYLKSEKGVHRLIRISPFDANKKRHTSFASIDIIPEFNDDINIEIKEQDLKIDVYRSSGAGGQSVNTTDSAVRITHLPTKIVVSCQNERSQIKNKEKAFSILKNKLYQLELEKKQRELQSIQGEYVKIEFGSQIRTYTMHPYTMVKDHRTEYSTSNVEEVLDGNLDDFMASYLKGKK
jgi:peptide chain release factor 2